MIFQLRPEFEQATGSAQPIGHLLLVGVQRVQFDPDRSGDTADLAIGSFISVVGISKR